MITVVGDLHAWGVIPEFLNENDRRSAKAQFNDKYIGGWHHFPKFKFDAEHNLKYPGDPVMRPLSVMFFRDEVLYIYESAWVVIMQLDGSWEVSRMD